MRVDVYASERHYLDHLLPIYEALSPEHQGRVILPRSLAHRVPCCSAGHPQRLGRGPVLVASWQDHHRCWPRPVIFVEHGAGQAYQGCDHPSYSGGRRREGAILFIVPSERVAERNRAAYPDIPNAVVGCPKMDALHGHETATDSPRGPAPTIALTFHADVQGIVPETRWALPHYESALPGLARHAKAKGWKLLGHGHPRAWGKLRGLWASLGVEPVEDWRRVMQEANLLVADTSSLQPEFASLRKPLLFLNQPAYRRDVHHQARFWVWPRGQVSVDEPGDLIAGIEEALLDPPAVQQARRRMVQDTYVATDGRASGRAARAIEEVLDAL